MLINNFIVLTLFLLNMALAVIVVFLERRSASTTWAWLMVLTFIPLLGFILYMVLGQNLRRRKVFKWDQNVHSHIQMESEQQLQQLKSGTASFLSAEVQQYRKLITMNLNNSDSIYTCCNDVIVYTDGKDKFDSLLHDMAQATKHIHLLYYIIRSDALGKRIVDVLIQKAAAGVHVRVIYDASGSRKLRKHFVDRLKRAGIEMIAFFPNRLPYLTFHLNFRNHRKIAVIDGEIGYIGGFNIGDEYLGMHPRFGYWRDTHLKIRGAAVGKLQRRFLLDWNQATQQELTLHDYTIDTPDQDGDVGIQIVSSGPDSRWEHIKNGFIEIIQSAKKYVYIQTPYFIPDDSMLDVLRIAASSGVDVRIMLPSIADHPFVYWATQSYFGELLRAGVKIYRYQNGFLHAKTIVADDQVASVGTANMDVRSFRLNFEVNAFLYDAPLATKLAQIFIDDVAQSKSITIDDYNNRPLYVRIKESVYRLLSPIL